jgi:hypothetical protein
MNFACDLLEPADVAAVAAEGFDSRNRQPLPGTRQMQNE